MKYLKRTFLSFLLCAALMTTSMGAAALADSTEAAEAAAPSSGQAAQNNAETGNDRNDQKDEESSDEQDGQKDEESSDSQDGQKDEESSDGQDDQKDEVTSDGQEDQEDAAPSDDQKDREDAAVSDGQKDQEDAEGSDSRDEKKDQGDAETSDGQNDQKDTESDESKNGQHGRRAAESASKSKRSVTKSPKNAVTYPVWVGNTQVTGENKDDILGDGGKAKYDPDTNTLTLNNPENVKLNNSFSSYICADGIPLILKGSAAFPAEDAAYCTRAGGKLELDGDFTFKGKQNGISAPSVIISGGTVSASAKSGSGIECENLSITGGDVTANGYEGITVTKLEITGGKLTAIAEGDDTYGISAGSVKIGDYLDIVEPKKGSFSQSDFTVVDDKGEPARKVVIDKLAPWKTLQKKIDKADSGAVITLDENVTAEEDDAALLIPAEKDITINLNGYDIDRARKEKGLVNYIERGYVIRLEGKLTLEGSGNITGGKNRGNGGGIYVAGGTLNLNGGSITGNEAKANLNAYGGGVFVESGTINMGGGTISNNKARSSGGGVWIETGSLDMTGGTISGNEASLGGGGVFVKQPAVFTMSSGSITGNTGRFGGGVSVSGNSSEKATFTMTGGSISENEARINASGDGGGVYVTGTFNLKKGTISGNKSSEGGGVYVFSNEFNMEGGTISGNKAYYGGGVYDRAVFTMTGGSITGNTADESIFGGGVFVESGKTFNLSGAPVIKDNEGMDIETEAAIDNNVFLEHDQTLINVSGPLKNTDKIGVTLDILLGPDAAPEGDSAVFTSGYNTAMGDTLPRDYFTSDDPRYAVGLTQDGKEARLGEAVKVTFDSDGGSNVESQSIIKGDTASEPEDPTKEGFSLKGWYQVTDGALAEEAFDFENTPITDNITLKAVWEELKYHVWVGNTPVTYSNKDDILGDGGSARFDPKTNTLTLNGPAIRTPYEVWKDGPTAMIYADLEGTLVIKGSATLRNPGSDKSYTRSNGIYTSSRTSVELNGNFTVEAGYYGIATYNLTISGGRITVDSAATVNLGGKLIMNGGALYADTKGKGIAVAAYGGITIADGLSIVEPEGGRVSEDGIEIVEIVDGKEKTAKHVVIIPADLRFTVTFDTDGGSDVEDQKVGYGKTAEKPSDPIKKGYIFDGWYEDPGFSVPFDFSKAITDDTTVYAKWKEDPSSADDPSAPSDPSDTGITKFTITYDLNGGTLDGKTGIVTVQAKEGSTITLPSPVREGYTFDYWKGSRYEAGASYKVEGDHTFTAQWKKNSAQDDTDDTTAADDDDKTDGSGQDKTDGSGQNKSGGSGQNKSGGSSSSSRKGGPGTGDEANTYLLIIITILSGLALAGITYEKKKHRSK